MDSNKIFILIDTSYWIFYRYYAIDQWFKHSKPDEQLENPYDNKDFVDKFIKTFKDSLNDFKKKQKLNNKKLNNDITIIAARDCPRKEIWRNELYQDYKKTRENDDSFMGGPFFKMVYDNDNKFIYDSGVNYICKYPSLEADDIIAILKKNIRNKYNDALIYIIANDHDYLQLLDENTKIINFKNKNLLESKKVFDNPDKNLFYKIVLGDKSDNIMPIFKKCGPKTCEKYYNNNYEEFENELKKNPDTFEKFKLNRKLISFDEIPINLINDFINHYENVLNI